MDFPFTTSQFFEVFRNYNQSVFPVQLIFYFAGCFIIYFLFKQYNFSNRIISSLLGVFWIWMGIVYHIIFFSPINKAAYVFGGLFILQGMFFLYTGSIKNKISYRFQNNILNYTGLILIVYALVVYPLIGNATGHTYPAAPIFSLPCPTAIFTFGVLLFTDKVFPKYILIIPVIWAIIGFNAALKLSIVGDYGLLLAGLLGLFLILLRDKRIKNINTNN